MTTAPPDPRRPVFHWYRDTPAGTELVFSLYTRGCIYGLCSFCSLPSLSAGKHSISSDEIKAQVDFIVAQYDAEKIACIEKVSVYNSGSVLDQRTLPTDALWHLFERVAAFPRLKLVSLESRAEFVEAWEIEGIKERLQGVELEIAVGYETHDERIRNKVLKKGLGERAFIGLCELLAHRKARLKAYVMVKPDAVLSESEGVDEAVRTLLFLDETGDRLGLRVTAHLNPTYVAKGSLLEKEFNGQGYTPPRLWSVVEILHRVRDRGLPIQIGLETEGLAVEGGSFRNCGRCDDDVREALSSFSMTQDYDSLSKLSCACR
jgi:radical SAM enzyme (TIGR01210 family)